jgi:hypothetical protein
MNSQSISLLIALVGVVVPLAFWLFASRLLHRSEHELEPVLKGLDKFIAASANERRSAVRSETKAGKPKTRLRAPAKRPPSQP